MHTGPTFAGCGEKTIKSLADGGPQQHDLGLAKRRSAVDIGSVGVREHAT